MTKRRTTRQLLAKIPNVPCLYRHKINGNYYGIKKINGKEKDHSLDSLVLVWRVAEAEAKRLHAQELQPDHLGGNGSSIADAVAVVTSSSLVGVPAEYAYIQKQCGAKGIDWKLKSQCLLDKQPDGRDIEVLEVELKNGSTKQFFFDISAFYGRF